MKGSLSIAREVRDATNVLCAGTLDVGVQKELIITWRELRLAEMAKRRSEAAFTIFSEVLSPMLTRYLEESAKTPWMGT